MRITGGLVFDGKEFVKKDLFTAGKLIADSSNDDRVVDADGCYVIPGLCDVHFHGCKGYDLCDCSVESIGKMAEYELANGITSIVPATMSLGMDKLKNILNIASEYKKSQNVGAALLGINLEGPFLNPSKCGAQKVSELCKPDISDIEKLLEIDKNIIKLIDIAPELDGAMEFIEKFSDRLHISLAHSEADYDTAIEAFNNGADHVTHLYNAMNPFHHRDTGIIGAAFDTDGVFAELIVDGHHVSKSAVRTAFKMLGSDKVVMISDSCRACGMDDGEYDLGGQKVYKHGSYVTLGDNATLAGSVCNLMDCMRLAVVEMGLELTDVVMASCVNSIKSIGEYERYGSLDEGKAADIVILDEGLNIVKVIKSGKCVEDAGGR